MGLGTSLTMNRSICYVVDGKVDTCSAIFSLSLWGCFRRHFTILIWLLLIDAGFFWSFWRGNGCILRLVFGCGILDRDK